MVEAVESALQHHQHQHQHRGNMKRPTRHLIKRRSSGRVPVVSSGNKRATAVAPLTTPATKTHPTTTAESSHDKSKAQAISAVTNDNNTTSRKAPSSVASAATVQPHGLSRTQQKLLLQRQQCQVEDETTMIHPNNMRRLTRELDRVGREYRCVKQFQDPMRLSLERCIFQQEQQKQMSEAVPTAAQVHRRHLELKVQRQQKNMRNSLDVEERGSTMRSSPAASSRPMIQWSAGAFLDRVLWSGPNSQ